MVKTSAERTKKHRKIKQAEQFSNEFMEGKSGGSAKSFIEAKEHAIQREHMVASVSFNQELLNKFDDNLEDCFANDDGEYTVVDMLEAWKMAEQED
jgi:hypothetical protein